MLRKELKSLISLPLISVIISPTFSPAFSAGELDSIELIMGFGCCITVKAVNKD